MLGGADWMALPVCGDAGWACSRKGTMIQPSLGLSLVWLLAGAMRGMGGELGMNGKTFGFLIGFIHTS